MAIEYVGMTREKAQALFEKGGKEPIAIPGHGREIEFDGRVNGREARITELATLVAGNGYELSLIIACINGRNHGPMLAEPPFEQSTGWGYGYLPPSDSDICFAAADTIREVLVQRNLLVEAVWNLLNEIAEGNTVSRNDPEFVALADIASKVVVG